VQVLLIQYPPEQLALEEHVEPEHDSPETAHVPSEQLIDPQVPEQTDCCEQLQPVPLVAHIVPAVALTAPLLLMAVTDPCCFAPTE